DVINAEHKFKTDKRIGWMLDSMKHVMFNGLRPTLRCAKRPLQFNRAPVGLLDRVDIIFGRALHMLASIRRIVFQAGVVFLILVWVTAIGPEPPARITISPSELVRAVTI